MGFQLSAGVQTKEIDLSTSIPAVATSLGATVGRFTWGPVSERTLITSENDLVAVFGTPNNDSYPSFLSAAAFLKYANSLQTVRVVDAGAVNALMPSTTHTTDVQIKNDEDFETQKDGLTLTDGYYARYPGIYGNKISVETSNEAAFGSFAYAGAFEVSPDNANNEVAVAVLYDGAVVETYLVSTDEYATDGEGTNIFMEEVINKMSKLVWTVGANVDNTQAWSYALAGGLETTVGADDYIKGWDLFTSPDEVDVNLLISGGVSAESEEVASTVQRYMIQTIAEGRKDCVAFVNAPKSLVVNVGGAANAIANVQEWRTAQGSYTVNHMNVPSSYGMLDANYKYTYDKYNDTYRWVSLSGDMAGLCAYTDSVADAWWSPGGLNRGQIKGVVKLAYNPNRAQRDQLYKLPYGINPVVTFPGQGTVLWGDRTMLTKPSAFDRINVRRLFIVLEKAIAYSAKYFLFEFNDEFTRAQFRNMVNPFLADIQGRRGMYEYFVLCDSTNNTGEVIDRNEFIASIFIKPAKSINFITLNFVAVKTGVEFSEVFGAV